MELETIRITLQTIGNFMGIVIIPLMTIILARKIYYERKETNQWNIIRCLMLGIFVAFSWALIWANLYESTPLREVASEEIIGTNVYNINLFSIGTGFMVTFALTLIAYANKWEVFYYTPFFIFGGFLVFYLLTGFDAWYRYFIYITAIIGLIFFYITGFRIKDNSSLGLGIFFTIAFCSLILGEGIIGQIFNISYSVFAVIFVLGYFKPFKELENVSIE